MSPGGYKPSILMEDLPGSDPSNMFITGRTSLKLSPVERPSKNEIVSGRPSRKRGCYILGGGSLLLLDLMLLLVCTTAGDTKHQAPAYSLNPTSQMGAKPVRFRELAGSVFSMLNFCSTMAMLIRISCSAKPRPMHARKLSPN